MEAAIDRGDETVGWTHFGATVSGVVGDRLRLAELAGEARVAPSCLLVPEPDDEVLAARDDAGRVFVLAVLARARPSEPARWRANAGAVIETDGQLDLVGREGVRVRSPKTVELGAPEVSITALEASVSSDRMRFVGRLLTANAEAAKTVIGTVDHCVERLSQRLKRSYRFIEELDSTRAGQIDQRAQSTLSIRAQNALVTARDLFKVDGEQIHLG